MKKQLVRVLSLAALAAVVGALPSCGTVNRGNGEDVTKANLSIATFDGGVGVEWIEKAARRFEEKYKDADYFQEGRTGVKISVVANKSYDGNYLLESTLSKDIYFTEGVDYINVANTGKFLDLTDTLNEKLTSYGEDKTVLEKIDDNLKGFLARQSKYYAVPFYDAFYGFIYDVTLFKDRGFYISKSGNFTSNLSNLSDGPDGVSGTSDDGLPATYEQFGKLLKQITSESITPLSYSVKYDEYILRTLTNYWMNYEGVEQAQLNYDFNGTATHIVSGFNSDGTPNLVNQDISFANGYTLQKQAGKYYALDFLQNILCSDAKNYAGAATHTGAQSSFVEGKHYGDSSARAMLVDGSWWENEAKDAFASLEYNNFEKSDYALMPIPHVDASRIGTKQTILSQNNSYGFVAGNSNNIELAKEFMKFLHTDAELSAFTAATSMTRALRYDIASSNLEKVTSYGKSLIDYKSNCDIVYPCSSLPEVINNASYFATDSWAWTSRISGSDYKDPWKYMTESKSPSAVDYFNGLHKFFSDSWSNFRA